MKEATAMYLGIDCGTQGTKTLLVTEAGKTIGRGYSPHQLLERSSGLREQEPAWWVEALVSATREALTSHADSGLHVKAIGVSGQQHGLVVLDEHMKVIRPAKLWNDTETAPQNEELLNRFGGRRAWLERFGIVPMTGYTVSKLLWMQEVCPQDFERIRHILLPHEYLNWWLTGVVCAEAGDASGTAFFDPRNRGWSRDILDSIDGGTGKLFAALPPLIESTSSVGRLRPEVADKLGLTTDCLVSSGGGDNMMGAIGTGNVREGVVTLSLGTSSTVYSYSESPIHDASGTVAPFCSSSGGWMPLVCTMNATNVVTSTVHLLGKTVADIDPALGATPPGADGLVFLPFLNGERTPDLPHARGTLTGLSSTNFTAEGLIRAAVEGVSFGILNGLDRIMQGKSPEEIQVIGGGARSKQWRQLLSDATGAKVALPTEQEPGCLGAAIQAHVAWSTAHGVPVSFQEAVRQMIPTGPAEVLSPNLSLRTAYDDARMQYLTKLRELYPGAD